LCEFILLRVVFDIQNEPRNADASHDDERFWSSRKYYPQKTVISAVWPTRHEKPGQFALAGLMSFRTSRGFDQPRWSIGT
jgi:hypothetical protein